MRHFTASVSDKGGCRLMPAISITTACKCTYVLCVCVSLSVCARARVCVRARVGCVVRVNACARFHIIVY